MNKDLPYRVVVRSHKHIYGLIPAQIERIQKDLTFDNPKYARIKQFSQWGSTREPQYLEYFGYDPHKNCLSVPVGYKLPAYIDSHSTFEDRRVYEKIPFPEMVLDLRDTQSQAVARFIQANCMKRSINGCIQMPTGKGKSIVALEIARILGARTLIVVHKTDLVNGWLRDIQKAFDGRLKLVSEPDNGIYDAMNKGIRLAKGELIGIINSDDYYEMTAVQDMVDSLKEDDPYQILYGFLKKINNGVVTQILMTRHENIRNVMIPHPTCFITKKLYDDVGMYDTKYRSCADYEFALRMSKNPRVHFVPVYKVISTFDDGGMSSKYSSQKETLKMRKEYGLVTKKQYLFGRIKLFVKRVVG